MGINLTSKLGFTVAEVIIVLGIIGIIALNTLPVLITDVTNTAMTQSKDLTLRKITEATNEMKTNDVLDGYATTDAFVDMFQKYIKTTKRCSSANLNECFTSKLTTGDGDEINTTSLKTGTALGHNTYNSPTVGLELINGTTIILAFDPACKRIEFWDNTTSTTSCMAMLYDVNGFKGPNKIGKDIATLNATVSSCDGAKIGNLCVGGGDVTYLPKSENPYNSNDNYWAGARDACAAQGMRLPTGAELSTMYANRAALGIPEGWYWYWSSDVDGNYSAYRLQFIMSGYLDRGNKNESDIKARCVK